MEIRFRAATQWTRAAAADAPAVRNGALSALRRAAAYLWRVARNSIRRSTARESVAWTDAAGRSHQTLRFRPAPPGKPPYAHGRWWKDSFHFAIDAAALAAYIGPVGGRVSRLPSIHEFGEAGVVRFRRYDPARRATIRDQKTVVFPRRPTMGPALERARPRLAAFWADAIRP